MGIIGIVHSLDGTLLQKFNYPSDGEDGAVTVASNLDDTIGGLGTAVCVHFDLSPTFLSQFLDLGASLADDATGLTLVHEHAGIGFIPLLQRLVQALKHFIQHLQHHLLRAADGQHSFGAWAIGHGNTGWILLRGRGRTLDGRDMNQS